MARPKAYATEEEREAARAKSIAKYRASEKYKAARDRYYEDKGVETARKYYQDNKDKLQGYQAEWYWTNKTSYWAHYQIAERAKLRDAESERLRLVAEAKLKEEREKRNAEKKAKRDAVRKEKYLDRLQKRKDDRKAAKDNK